MATTPTSLRVEPVSGRATLAALAIVLIPLLYNLLDGITVPGLWLLSPALLLSFFCLLIVVLVKGFPRWSLPLAGLALALGGFLALGTFQQWVAPNAGPWIKVTPGDENGRLAGQAITSGVLWFGYLILTVAVVLITAIVPPLRPFYRRVQQDWTLLSFLVYGAALLTVAFAFDEYGHDKPYQIVSMAWLAAGMLGYLLNSRPWPRLLSLLGSITLSMTVVAGGKWIIVPRQDWPVWFGWHPPEVERWFESLRTLMELGWMLLVMAAPALLALRPRPAPPTPAGQPGGERGPA